MRQVFNGTGEEVLWPILGAPGKEFGPGEKFDLNLFRPTDPCSFRRSWPASTGGQGKVDPADSSGRPPKFSARPPFADTGRE